MATIIKLPFKVIAAMFVVVLTILVPFLKFLFCYAEVVLNLLSVIFVIISVTMLIMDTSKTNGIAILVFAFLLSPFGITRIADGLFGLLDGLNWSLKDFIMS